MDIQEMLREFPCKRWFTEFSLYDQYRTNVAHEQQPTSGSRSRI